MIGSLALRSRHSLARHLKEQSTADDQQQGDREALGQGFAQEQDGHRRADRSCHRADLAEVNRTGRVLQPEASNELQRESEDVQNRQAQQQTLIPKASDRRGCWWV